MSSALPKDTPNLVLALLGAAALVHSIVHFGTGAIPEAILAVLLFLKAFADRKQPWAVMGMGLLATAITWVVNSGRVARRTLTGSEPVYYYFSDHLGSHSIISDNNGNVAGGPGFDLAGNR
jgi:hypothetical protein